MKKLIFWVALTVMLGLTGIGGLPVALTAAETVTVQLEPVTPALPEGGPVELDFSDAEFARADQPEQGLKTAGDVVVVSSVAVAVVVCVVILLVLL